MVADPEPLRNQANYRITEADLLGAGSLKQKCRDNLAAIESLKRLEVEGRPATEDEKRVLDRYVGWAGLPQVFDSWNEEWKEQRERLEQLLTPDELESARATTLNARYTALGITGFFEGRSHARLRFAWRLERILAPSGAHHRPRLVNPCAWPDADRAPKPRLGLCCPLTIESV